MLVNKLHCRSAASLCPDLHTGFLLYPAIFGDPEPHS